MEYSLLWSCLWWFKDEEFQAIHNIMKLWMNVTKVVYDGSKMKNFKQFTTISLSRSLINALSMMVQRWRISSNSQPCSWACRPRSRCLWWFKDEEFQAIHNDIWDSVERSSVVYDGSKMKNFKQFTTCNALREKQGRLSMMVQRWRISSNSQRYSPGAEPWSRCLWWFKDEEFQAIHNE